MSESEFKPMAADHSTGGWVWMLCLVAGGFGLMGYLSGFLHYDENGVRYVGDFVWEPVRFAYIALQLAAAGIGTWIGLRAADGNEKLGRIGMVWGCPAVTAFFMIQAW